VYPISNPFKEFEMFEEWLEEIWGNRVCDWNECLVEGGSELPLGLPNGFLLRGFNLLYCVCNK
jgi:hypothetical protein